MRRSSRRRLRSTSQRTALSAERSAREGRVSADHHARDHVAQKPMAHVSQENQEKVVKEKATVTKERRVMMVNAEVHAAVTEVQEMMTADHKADVRTVTSVEERVSADQESTMVTADHHVMMTAEAQGKNMTANAELHAIMTESKATETTTDHVVNTEVKVTTDLHATTIAQNVVRETTETIDHHATTVQKDQTDQREPTDLNAQTVLKETSADMTTETTRNVNQDRTTAHKVVVHHAITKANSNVKAKTDQRVQAPESATSETRLK